MAQSNWEQITLQDGTVARQYPDGSIRNERGHMVVPLPGKHVITQADASALARRGHELKRQILAESANAAVQRGDFKLAYGSMAYVAEIGYSAQLKAQNVDDPKQIDAARFLLQETGLSEKAAQAEAQADDPLRMIGAMALEYIKQRMTIPINVHATNSGETLEK